MGALPRKEGTMHSPCRSIVNHSVNCCASSAARGVLHRRPSLGRFCSRVGRVWWPFFLGCIWMGSSQIRRWGFVLRRRNLSSSFRLCLTTLVCKLGFRLSTTCNTIVTTMSLIHMGRRLSDSCASSLLTRYISENEHCSYGGSFCEVIHRSYHWRRTSLVWLVPLA